MMVEFQKPQLNFEFKKFIIQLLINIRCKKKVCSLKIEARLYMINNFKSFVCT